MVLAVGGTATAQSSDEVTWSEKNGTVAFALKGDPTLAAQATAEYWTAERMAEAQPMPLRTTVVLESAVSAVKTPSPGVPGLVEGHPPGGGPFVEKVHWFPELAQPRAEASPQSFGTVPTDPLNGPYPPFQRWSMEGDYKTWPRSIHGKVFFILNQATFVCSATVIGRSTIATAGHCVSDGAGSFATNFVFCPSYITTGVNPLRGCWGGTYAVTSTQWHANGNLDYDYGCVVLDSTGTVWADKVGNVTGWASRSFNWPDTEEVTFGYASGPPFTGNIIIMRVGPEWYSIDSDGSGGQALKFVGDDMTGHSGGAWILGWRHPNAEIGDTDGNPYTDAGAANLALNGVNSTKRCRTSCLRPPTSSEGVFWQEVGSPPFLSTSAAGESEDILGTCLAHPNNNP
jgi:hypothetical protein